MTQKYWYIVPKLIIDSVKYKGKGRPKKEDYRLYPNDNDFIKNSFSNSKTDEGFEYKIKIPLLQKGIIASIGDNINHD